MSSSSRIPGFYKLPPEERRSAIEEVADLVTEEVEALDSKALTLESADLMVENVIGTFGLPLAVGVNFVINGSDLVVPMVVEEPSVVAAVSNMARLVRDTGGFEADADDSVMIGQIQIVDLSDLEEAKSRLEEAIPELMDIGGRIHPRLKERGGGLRGMNIRRLRYDEPGETPEDMLVLHFHLDCVDAMGANMVNTVAERLAPRVEQIAKGRVALRILSNLASHRRARARCVLPFSCLQTEELDGEQVARGIAQAYRFAWTDPWRAATHNKGIMNGIDAVALATGNDWRAIEAGAHAWAARDGQYRSLSTWRVRGQALVGELELPLQVGTVGGPIRNHPACAANLKILGNPGARALSEVMAAVGLAQNLGALRALATEGIQRGHMRMHARNVAVQAGALPHEVDLVVKAMSAQQEWSEERARAILATMRMG
jgi:hydroxymethylglutaryl-CoA reductase